MPAVPITTLLAVFIGTGLMFAAIWIFVSLWLERGRTQLARVRPGEDSDPTITLDSLYAGGANATWWDRFRRGAAERMERTELRLTLVEGVGIVLFSGVILAAIFFFWR